MTTSHEHTVGADIERAVRAVSGVAALFRAGTLASNVLDAGARVIGIRDDLAPFVRLDQTPDALRVDIAIGVHQYAGAVETIRRVQTAARAVIEEQHLASAKIRITVVHINDTPRQGGQEE